jgi:hypothetical protein
MEPETDICSSCGREKEIHHETMISNQVNKRYCKECYDILNKKINCKVCGEEMSNIDYFKQLREFHPKYNYRDFVQFR